MLHTTHGKLKIAGSLDSCLFSNVALAVAEVVHVTDEHGVGKGGYDCNAGASNWMQGWPLDQTHGVFSEVIKNCLANKENTTIETVNFFNVQPTAADISSGCLGRQRRRIGAAATATASTASSSIAMQNTCSWLVIANRVRSIQTIDIEVGQTLNHSSIMNKNHPGPDLSTSFDGMTWACQSAPGRCQLLVVKTASGADWSLHALGFSSVADFSRWFLLPELPAGLPAHHLVPTWMWCVATKPQEGKLGRKARSICSTCCCSLLMQALCLF